MTIMFMLTKPTACLKSSLFLCLVVGAVWPSAADEDTSWIGGLGVYTSSNPFVGAESEGGFFPYVAYQGKYFAVDITEASLRLAGTETAVVDALLAPRWILVEPDQSPALADIDRKTGLDAGVRATKVLRNAPMTFSAEYRGDVSGRSEGHEISLAGSLTASIIPELTLDVSAGAAWRDDALSSYLYGVAESEARNDRPAYATGDTITPFISTTATWSVSQNWSLIVAANAEALPREVQDSPIVEDDVTGFFFAGVVRTF